MCLFIEVKNLQKNSNKIVMFEESVVIYYKIRQQLAKLGKEIEEYLQTKILLTLFTAINKS